MGKTLVFFGAFNPPTKAHIDLAHKAMEETGAENVLFVPSKSSYIADVQRKDFFVFTDDERLEMLTAVAENNDWVMVSNHDIISEGQPRSYDTLKWLKEKCSFDPVLLVGADQFREMEYRWKNVAEIAQEFGIVVLQRFGIDLKGLIKSDQFYRNIKEHITIVKTPKKYLGTSSTKVRFWIDCLKQEIEHHKHDKRYMKVINKDIAHLKKELPAEVFKYIKERYLK